MTNNPAELPPLKILLTQFDWNLQWLQQMGMNEPTDYNRDATLQRFESTFDTAVKSFLSKDVSYSNGIIDKQTEIEELRKKILSLQLSSKTEDISVIYPISSIRDSVEKIGEYAADIAELTIDRTYRAEESDAPYNIKPEYETTPEEA